MIRKIKWTHVWVLLFCFMLAGLVFRSKHYQNILILKIKSQIHNNRIYGSYQSMDVMPNLGIDSPRISVMNTSQSQTTTTAPDKRSSTKTTIKLPSMTLTVRTHSKPGLLKFFYCDLLRSTSLYWSKELGNMTLILDEESAQDKVLAAHLHKQQKSMGINFNFIYEPLPNRKILEVKNGKSWHYNRQLYSSFLMDHVTKTDIIAWIDTDAKFITPVTKENIITDGKLRVKGMNTFYNSWIKTWDDQTKIMIGYRMPSDFMTYFPVYIWKDTITNCRNYIIKHMKVQTIEEAFKSANQHGYLSPVNVILTYAYYFERERYDWHIDITPLNLRNVMHFEEYNKLRLAPGNELNSSHTTLDLHVALHTKYYIESYNINRQFYCAAINNTSINLPKHMREQCKEFRGKLLWPLFEFCNDPVQGHLNTWCKTDKSQCVSFINKHYDRVRQAVKDGLYDLDLSKVKAVEESAGKMNITCPAFF